MLPRSLIFKTVYFKSKINVIFSVLLRITTVVPGVPLGEGSLPAPNG